jgi:hypothetical protein
VAATAAIAAAAASVAVVAATPDVALNRAGKSTTFYAVFDLRLVVDRGGRRCCFV